MGRRESEDYKNFDTEIKKGHEYAALFIQLSHTKDEGASNQIRQKMERLLQGSKYLSEVLASHPDPISFLANRRSRNSLMVFNRGLSIQSKPKMSNSVREITL